MLVRESAFYRDFRCVGGGCPLTCCRDWSIVPDGDALEDYAHAPAGLRERIAENLAADEDGDICFRLTGEGLCALLDGDGLCAIQRQWGEAHLCAHCAAYPRFNEEYGSLTENSLAVSCPEAARLTMERGIFPLVEADDGAEGLPFDGVDPALLDGLVRTRAAAFSLLAEDGQTIWERLAAVLRYAGALQPLVDGGRYDELPRCPLPAPAPGPSPESLRAMTAALLERLAEAEPLRPGWPVLLRRRAGELCALSCEDYAELSENYAAAQPQWDAHLARLGEALLFRHWPKTVNDNLLYGRAAFVLAACAVLHHLALLGWREAPAFSDGDEALLWAAFSREVEHDEGTLSTLINIFQKTLDRGGLLL